MTDAVSTESRADILLRELLADATVSPTVRAKAKSMFPDVSFVEDKFDPYVADLKAQNAALAEQVAKIEADRLADKAAAEEAAAKAKMETALKDAAKSYGLTTEDGFNAMVEHMRATGNYTDPNGAAAYVASKAPKPEVPKPTFAPQHANLFGTRTDTGAEGLRLLHTDPLAFQDAQLAAFISDPDGFVEGRVGY